MKTNYKFKGFIITLLAVVFALPTYSQTLINGVYYKQRVVNEEALQEAETCRIPGDIPYEGAFVVEANVTLNGVTYPVTKIGDGTFRDSPSLTSVTIPEGVRIIGNSSFPQTKGLASLVLPSTVNSIEAWAFYGCEDLETINIPEGVTKIMEHTFRYVKIKNITLPSTCTELVYCAFQNANLLESINLDNVTSIGSWTFASTNLSYVKVKDVSTIGSEAFADCQNLESVELVNVIQIGDWCFQRSSKLKNVKLGESLASIGGGAFSGCGIESLVLPKSLGYIGNWVFEKNPLKVMYCSWAEPEEDVYIEEWFSGADDGRPDFVWNVPADIHNKYYLEDAWGDKDYVFMTHKVEIGVPSKIQNISSNDNSSVFFVNGSLNIKGLSGFDVSLVSITGQTIQQFGVNSNDMTLPLTLSKGVYVLKATNGAQKSFAKFMVK